MSVDGQPQEDEHSLTEKAARGVAWIVAARLVMRILGLINTIVVARLLTPDDFGVVAIGVTAVQLLQGFSDIGVSQAMVRFRDAGRDEIDTLFTLSLMRGVLLSIILSLMAPLAAGFFSDERVSWVFLLVAPYPLMLGLVNPKFFEFERNLDFSKEFVLLVAEKVSGVAVSLSIALIFRTYHAIVLGLLAGALFQLAVSYLLRPYRPRLTFKSLRRVLGFSGWLTGVAFTAALNNKLDSLILARALGTADAGRFYLGSQLAELPTTELAFPIARAIYPGLSALQGDPKRMRFAYLRGAEALAMVAMPAGLGFAFVAQDLIPLLLGEKWRNAATVVQLLTPVIAIQTIFLATQFYAMALGRTHLVFAREVAFFCLRTPLVIYGAVEHGLIGAVAAISLGGIVHMGLNLALYARISSDAPWRPLWGARRSFAAAGAMSAFFVLIAPYLPPDDWPGGLRLMVHIVGGGAVYLCGLAALWQLAGRPDGAEAAAVRLMGSIGRRRAARAH